VKSVKIQKIMAIRENFLNSKIYCLLLEILYIFLVKTFKILFS